MEKVVMATAVTRQAGKQKYYSDAIVVAREDSKSKYVNKRCNAAVSEGNDCSMCCRRD